MTESSSNFNVGHKVVVYSGTYPTADNKAKEIKSSPTLAKVVAKFEDTDKTKYPDGYLYHVETDGTENSVVKTKFVIASKDAYIPDTNDPYGDKKYNIFPINNAKVQQLRTDEGLNGFKIITMTNGNTQLAMPNGETMTLESFTEDSIIEELNKSADKIMEMSSEGYIRPPAPEPLLRSLNLLSNGGGGRRRRRRTKRAAKTSRRRRSAKRVRKTRR